MRAQPIALQRQDAAALLDISVDTFDRHVRPHVPVVYVGDVRLFPVDGLRAWLDSKADRPYAQADNTKRPRTASTAGGMAQGA